MRHLYQEESVSKQYNIFSEFLAKELEKVPG